MIKKYVAISKMKKKGETFRNLDRRSDICVKIGNISAACDLLEKGIELSLRPYNQVMREENSKGSAK